jgi:hypothetical protein
MLSLCLLIVLGILYVWTRQLPVQNSGYQMARVESCTDEKNSKKNILLRAQIARARITRKSLENINDDRMVQIRPRKYHPISLSPNNMPETLKYLIDAFAKLPGVGEKTAMKLAFHILTKKKELTLELSEKLINVYKNIDTCPRC